MKRRIFWSICAVALGAVLVVAVCTVFFLYHQNSQNMWQNLTAKAYYLSAAVEKSGPEYLETVRGYSGRVTLVAQDGTVLFDDRQPGAGFENHKARPEIQSALESGTGRAQRVSDTLGERTLYYALRLSDGTVLRVSATTSSVMGETLNVIPWMLLLMALVVLLAGGVARVQTKAIVKPINHINLERPLDEDAYGELSPLLRRIAAQKEEITSQIKKLRRKQDEFSVITRNMEEGLVVVNKEGMVLSINQSAREILGVEQEVPTGLHILSLARNISLEKAVKEAAGGQKVNEIVELSGRKYQLTASPSVTGGRVKGVVLLFLDETEKLLAEEKRREFAGNVSHELKTPLTSISGYAEIMHNGLAKPEDVQQFAGLIYEEANRLIALVEDIIKLSRLDEKGGYPEKEMVDMLELAQKTAASLSRKSQKKGIDLCVEGKSVVVYGMPSILGEVLYNLVDNAIRYSDDGQVTVQVSQNGQNAVVEVQDEGIGIPPEHQHQIFERFYRVDKSHSRGNGGTGLGLAIAKRGVLFHEGSISLKSKPGGGSTFVFSVPVREEPVAE